jgi:AAA+ ATPase superfamily predicted ATPase
MKAKTLKEMADIIKGEFSEDFYKSLTDEQRKEVVIRSVETGDYKEDPEWVELKEASNKAFKLLKKREYKIREYLNLKL